MDSTDDHSWDRKELKQVSTVTTPYVHQADTKNRMMFVHSMPKRQKVS